MSSFHAFHHPAGVKHESELMAQAEEIVRGWEQGIEDEHVDALRKVCCAEEPGRGRASTVAWVPRTCAPDLDRQCSYHFPRTRFYAE